MTGTRHRSSSIWYWSLLAVQLIVVWAAVFGAYEIVERSYLRDASPGLLHLLHILRGSGTAFLLAALGVRGVYRRREAFVLEAKERLAAEKTRQDRILSELGAGLIVLDEGYKVSYANATAQKWLGTKISERLCDMTDCLMGKTTGVCPARESSLQRGRVAFEEKLETPQGVRHLYITATPMPASDGRPSGGIIELIQDVTPLKEMEARLRQTAAAARTGAIASGIAHQLGNPLATISAAVERLLSLGAAKQEAYARYVQRIEIESERAAQIVRSLMDLARRIGRAAEQEGNGRDSTDVCASIREAVTTLAERRDHIRHAVKLYLPEHPLPARASDTDVREVLVNLIDNAAAAASIREQPRVSIHASEDRGTVLIQVCDNGPGVEESLTEKIFEPFFTTRKSGTGLGLYVCREIVEACGGEIQVNAMPAGGAKFLVRLPAVPAPAACGAGPE